MILSLKGSYHFRSGILNADANARLFGAAKFFKLVFSGKLGKEKTCSQFDLNSGPVVL